MSRSTKKTEIRLHPDRPTTSARRLPKPERAAPTRLPSAAPAILDGVRDQEGGSWLRFGMRHRAIWFAVADLVSDSTGVFRRLSAVQANYVTTQTQRAFKQKVEAWTEYRDALVARRPGWLETFYVFGDGEVLRPGPDRREVIVAFELNPKFEAKGTKHEWQAAVAPFVSGQPLPYFVLSLALTGPLLRFVPSDYLNPQVEIVGSGERGKTTLGVLAASIWAGNPTSDCGGGESWDITLNAVDGQKLAHKDGFLFADEGNLAGATLRERREFARQAVFKVAATGGKRRFGDPVRGENARLSLLSTTNTALADLLEDNEDVVGAAQTRMITIRLGKSAAQRVFQDLPNGYESAVAASEATRAAVDRCWGTAGRAFVARLAREIDHDEEKFRRELAERLARYRRRIGTEKGSARVQKTLALVAVAGRLAQLWGVLPKTWGSPRRVVRAVAKAALQAHADDDDKPLAQILSYREAHRSELIAVSALQRPLEKHAFDACPGFMRQSSKGEEILVPAGRFQAAFADHETLMKRLQQAGITQTEGGRHPKLTIKAPRAICSSGRVYCIRLRSGDR